MTKIELKELVKQHFNLVEANVEKFDKAELEDGSKVSNEEAGKFAIGQTLFIEDKDGKMVKAPEGEHVSTSGIQFILDKDSKITGLKYPDAKAIALTPPMAFNSYSAIGEPPVGATPIT